MVNFVLAVVAAIGLSVACGMSTQTAELMERAKMEWPQHKAKFNLTFPEKWEDERRFNIFADNFLMVETHNARFAVGLETYEMGMMQYSHMTNEEFNLMNGFPPEGYSSEEMDRIAPHDDDTTEYYVPDHLNTTISTNFDWCSKGAVRAVRNQGNSCGSCWTYATAAAVEGQLSIRRKGNYVISTQEILDCSRSYPNRGCNGGNPRIAMNDMKNRRYGLEQDRDYPYRARQGRCGYNSRKSVAYIRQVRTTRWNEASLLDMMQRYGPTAIFIDASNDLKHYRRGVFNGRCSSGRGCTINHLVTLCGNTGNTLKIKNSWGTGWGERGYLRVPRGGNKCCVLFESAVPAI